jgi:class 3 adenylate cyclase
MAEEGASKIRRFASAAIQRRYKVEKALNLQPRKIVEAMAAPRVLARFPHLQNQLRNGVSTDPLLMLVDLSPFSEVAAGLTATEIAGFLDAYYATVVKAVEDGGGIVEKYIGDAVCALFGSPFTVTTDDLLFEVVEIAKQLIRDSDKWFGGEVSAKVALAWGECFLGYVGPDQHQELTVVGNPLTVLFRLEAECAPNEIIALTSLFSQRPEGRVATLISDRPKWSFRTQEMTLRGVSSTPVEVTTLKWIGGR